MPNLKLSRAYSFSDRGHIIFSTRRMRSSGSSMDRHDAMDPFSDLNQQGSMDDDLPSIKELTDGFSDQRSLGAGAYGKVYMVCTHDPLLVDLTTL